MEHPRVEGQAERGQTHQAGPEVRPLHQVRSRGDGTVADHLARVPRRGVAHAAESPAAGAELRLQHGLDLVAECEIGEADDARGDARRPVETAVAHRRDAGDELGLAHRPHLEGAGRAVHRAAFHEHGGDHVVTRAEIGQELVQQVPMIPPIPQVMVGVDDRQLGVENRLGRLLRQPRLDRRTDPSITGRLVVLAHRGHRHRRGIIAPTTSRMMPPQAR